MKVYRFNLDLEKFDNFLNTNRLFILEDKNISSKKDLDNFLLEEKNKKYKSLVNNFLKLDVGDFVWLRAKEEYALGKIKSNVFYNEALEVSLDIKKVSYEEVPQKLKKVTRGSKLISINDEYIFSESKKIYDKSYDYSSYVDSGLITIKNNRAALDVGYENTNRGNFPPALRKSGQVAIYKDRENIKINYKNHKTPEKEKHEEKNFDLIFEMNPKEEKEEKSLLPLRASDINMESLPLVYSKFLKLQFDFAKEFTKTSMENLAKVNIKFWQEYLKLLKEWN